MVSMFLSQPFVSAFSFSNIFNDRIPHSLTKVTKYLAKRDFSPPIENSIRNDNEANGLLYSVDLPKNAGISWGSDLSFRWIFVRDIDLVGEAAQCGLIKKGVEFKK